MTSRQHVLIVEDEGDIRMLLEHALAREGFRVSSTDAGDKAVPLIEKDAPDLILLDLMLPGLSGMDVCRRIKKNPKTAEIPVIMITAKGEESDVVAGLELGAEDYVTKPFSTKVLVARVRAVLRRGSEDENGAPDGDIIKVHDIVIHPGRREVFVAENPVTLTFTEFQILTLIAKKPGWVFTRYQIVDGVRGGDYPVTERSIDVQIVGLRKKLGDAGKIIETVRGVGYRLKG
jgi:two-component system phosphate regulon response regulator PhoB